MSTLEYEALSMFKYDDLPIRANVLAELRDRGYLEETGNHIVTKNANGETITAFTYTITRSGLLALSKYEIDAEYRKQKVKDIVAAYEQSQRTEAVRVSSVLFSVIAVYVVDHWSEITAFFIKLFGKL